MKPKLDLNIIAKGLGAKRRGKVVAHSGYFGAMQLVADIPTGPVAPGLNSPNFERSDPSSNPTAVTKDANESESTRGTPSRAKMKR